MKKCNKVLHLLKYPFLYIGLFFLGTLSVQASGLENFDSYSPGDLNSQNGGTGWSAAWSRPYNLGSPQVVSGVYVSSSNSGRFENVDSRGGQRYFTYTGDVTQYSLSLKSDITAGQINIDFRDGTYVYLGGAMVKPDGVYLNHGPDNTSTYIAGFPTDWIEVFCELKSSTDEVRCKVGSGGSWTDWEPLALSRTTDQPTGIVIHSNNANEPTKYLWVDDIYVGEPQTEGGGEEIVASSTAGALFYTFITGNFSFGLQIIILFSFCLLLMSLFVKISPR